MNGNAQPALTWAGTAGGPHVLLPEPLLDEWRGAVGCTDPIDPADPADYARACRIRTWTGAIPCGSGTALVFSGDVGPIAWIPSEAPGHGHFVQWVGIDDEALIAPALQTVQLAQSLAAPDAETLEFDVAPPGSLILFDSAETGRDMRACLKRSPFWTARPIEHLRITLASGRYKIRSAYFEAPGIMMAVREVSLLGDGHFRLA
jgi:Immunity protein 21